MIGLALPAVLLCACSALSLIAFSSYRRQRAELRSRSLGETELYAAGKAAAAARAKVSRSPLATMLHEAGIETVPSMWVAQALCAVFLAGCLAAALSGSCPVGFFAGGAAAAAIWLRVGVLRARRSALLDRQFCRALPQIAGGVRSSLTLERAIRAVAAHVDDPLREELARVLADAAYGTSLNVSLEEMARRTASPDVQALAAAVRVQQRFGGAIAPVLDMIAAHANVRLKMSRELRTELAGTRLAKWFVAAAMPAIFLLMFVANPDFARFYAEEPLGWAVAGVAALCEVGGLLACRRITSVSNSGR